MPVIESSVASRLLLPAALGTSLFAVVMLMAEPPTGDKAVLKFTTTEESKAEYQKTVVPFFAKHCVICHGPKKQEGDLAVEKLDPDMKASTSAARWAMLLEKLCTREMPPESRPRPDEQSLEAVVRWINAEMKRAGKHSARRAAYANGNAVPHKVLFDPKNVPPFDAAPQVRRLSPEIYQSFLNEHAKGKPGVGQPFSPEGKTTFKDMGAPKIDEPLTSQLIRNALLIVETETAFKIEDGKVKGNGPRELFALFDPNSPPTEAQMEAAVVYQFNAILKRAPNDEEKKKFTAFMKKNVAEAGQVTGARYALAAVMLLPEAVFRMEVGNGKPDAKGRLRLGPREIAFSLSYALTDRRPDAELLKAAATGELDSDEGVAKQARRLLDDEKAEKPRMLRFFREYFGYGNALEVFKNDKDNPEHDARALVEDTDRLVQTILEQDKDVLKELLTTNRSFVAYKTAADTKKKRAEALAKFEAEKKSQPEKFKDKKPPKVGRNVYEAYGLKDFPDAQPVELPPSERAGILTQPAWLVAHSTSDDNHAIHRGKWIRERLLGGVVPDIPITVDAQLPQTPEKTLRERMRVTQEKYCWQCHQFMNDTGLTFEMFDHFGRYRTAETVLDVEATAKNVDKKGKPLGPVTKGVPVDAKGMVAHVGVSEVESKVENAIELMMKLAGSEYVEQVFVRHAFRYWLGRNETPGDAATLQAAHQAYRASGGSFKALVVALLRSESFLYRVPTEAKDSPPTGKRQAP